MKELVINHNGQPCTTSRLVAETFGKRHSDVLRSIENLRCSQEFNQRNFASVEYTDVKGEKRPQYLITRDGFSFLVMGFSGKAARFKEEFIKAFNLMESKLRKTIHPCELSRVDILKMALESEEQRERLQKENERLRLKAQLMEKILDADEKIDLGQTAKILELPYGRNILFKTLRDKGIFFKNKNEPKQKYVHQGYFTMKERYIERKNHEGFMVLKTLVTQKGLAFISDLLGLEEKSKSQAAIA